MTKKTRTESDALGKKKILIDHPRGIYTERVLNNYPCGTGHRIPEQFLRTYIRSKMVYATVNAGHQKITNEIMKAIHKAGKQLLALNTEAFMRYFPISRIQSGGGTSTHMNINEVLANLASEYLGDPYGTYSVHPHDHVNASQSSNDTFPGTTKLTCLQLLLELKEHLKKLLDALHMKAKEFKDIKKVGRTHLEDAVVVTLGDEFSAYARTIKKHIVYLSQAKNTLLEINYGGTATGSMQNITTAIRKDIIVGHTKEFGLSLKQPKNYFEQNSSSADILKLSSELANLSTSLIKISNDLRLLNSGPLAGIHEIDLPEVQPGSSIMPGKVNPSIPEALIMICSDVIGKHETISVLSRSAQLELQQFMPMIAWSSIDALQDLAAGINMFTEKCIAGIRANTRNIQANLDNSFATATNYSEKLGYDTVAEAVQKALKTGSTLKELLGDIK